MRKKKTKHKPWFFYKKRKWTAGFGDVLFPKLPEFARSPGLQGRPWTHLLRFQGSSRSNLLPVSVNHDLFAHNWAQGPALPSPARHRSSATTAMASVSCWFCQSYLMLFPQWNNIYSPKYFPSRASPGKVYLTIWARRAMRRLAKRWGPSTGLILWARTKHQPMHK